MSWFHGKYKYVHFYSAGTDFRRQNLTSEVDPRAVRVKHQHVIITMLYCTVAIAL